MQSTLFRQKEEIHTILFVRDVLRNMQEELTNNLIAKVMMKIHL